jgi:heme exporter protein B
MWAIVRKDLTIERLTGEMLSSLFLLALLVILVFAFTLDPERLRGAGFVAGLLWTTLLLAGTLSLNRSFAIEREGGAWTALALAPLDRGLVYLGKTIANGIFLLVAAIALLPLLVLLLGSSAAAVTPVLLLASIVLGVAGMAAVGTLFAAMASRTRAREVLLPLLTFPILAPQLIGAARTTAAGLLGEPLSEASSWLLVLATFDIVFLTAGWLTFDYVVEE